jgi:hypothetical protein
VFQPLATAVNVRTEYTCDVSLLQQMRRRRELRLMRSTLMEKVRCATDIRKKRSVRICPFAIGNLKYKKIELLDLREIRTH